MKTEEELKQDFKDWLGWNDQKPPDQDDPDYYTYSWGLNVWINSYNAYYKKLSEITEEDMKRAIEETGADTAEVDSIIVAITNLLKGG